MVKITIMAVPFGNEILLPRSTENLHWNNRRLSDPPKTVISVYMPLDMATCIDRGDDNVKIISTWCNSEC